MDSPSSTTVMDSPSSSTPQPLPQIEAAPAALQHSDEISPLVARNTAPSHSQIAPPVPAPSSSPVSSPVLTDSNMEASAPLAPVTDAGENPPSTTYSPEPSTRDTPNEDCTVVTPSATRTTYILEPPPQRSEKSIQRDSGMASIHSSSSRNHALSINDVRIRERDTASAYGGTGGGGWVGHITASRSGAHSIAADARSLGGRSAAAVSVITPEDEVLSLKVRSLYDSGVGLSDSGSQFSAEGRKRVSSIMEESGGSIGKRGSRCFRNSLVVAANGMTGDEATKRISVAETIDDMEIRRSTEDEEPWSSAEEERREVVAVERSEYLLAGGTEDWEDLNGSDVDRLVSPFECFSETDFSQVALKYYSFKIGERLKRYGFINPLYTPAGAAGLPLPKSATGAFQPPKRISTALDLHSKTPRKRTHHLHLKLSLLPPLAPEMLRSPLPGLTEAELREKENSRAKKWRDMAIMRKTSERGHEGGRGAGAEWAFVTGDSKLISRTWKGIPDCWRAAAWHAFLTTSAKKRSVGQTEMELVEIYYELLDRPSSDDVQIDLDVPRTINSHIMFRRRYRGGQRLLFRVLHCLALYFPNVGYVQGMASLAATLLCYYEEETAFVMLVRMFELRGLEKLYEAGFGGLMEALGEFEGSWLKGGQVFRKLANLGVGPTAYGTRWYLTLFNYSIPFPAQLRVWDVFMLLGDPDPTSTTGFGGTMDVLHATSAALIDGMKDIILKSDFEGAMKVMTSWIPVKDEDLLMRIAKSEWRSKRRRKGQLLSHLHSEGR
ncbi:hypothetical protein RUND412_008517 [Rhizina undulata]